MADSASTSAPKRPNNPPKTKKRPISKDHIFRKRQPHKQETGKGVIYVSTKTNTKSLLQQCEKLILDNENEVILYCMGAAIQRGILLALQVCEKHAAFQIDAKTFTTELLDDLEPATDDADYEIQRRNNSALRIRLCRPETPQQPPK